jgi:hypothetical protein
VSDTGCWACVSYQLYAEAVSSAVVRGAVLCTITAGGRGTISRKEDWHFWAGPFWALSPRDHSVQYLDPANAAATALVSFASIMAVLCPHTDPLMVFGPFAAPSTY